MSHLTTGQLREARKLGWVPAGEEPKGVPLPPKKATAPTTDPKELERRTAWIKRSP